jgi:hypothetical protein
MADGIRSVPATMGGRPEGVTDTDGGRPEGVTDTDGGRHTECACYNGRTAHGVCLLQWADGHWGNRRGDTHGMEDCRRIMSGNFGEKNDLAAIAKLPVIRSGGIKVLEPNPEPRIPDPSPDSRRIQDRLPPKRFTQE